MAALPSPGLRARAAAILRSFAPVTLAVAWICAVPEASLARRQVAPPSNASDVRDLLFPDARGSRIQLETELRTAVVRARTAVLDVSALDASVERVRLELFADRVVTLHRAHLGTTNDRTWTGTVDGEPPSSAVFAVAAGAACGTIRIGHELYRIRSNEDGAAIVEEVDESRMPPCATTARQRIVFPEAPRRPQAPHSAVLPGLGPTIDVLVVYTPAARAGQGGTAAMNALIDLAFVETNQAYANSGVGQRIRLVHRAELTGFVESGNWGADLGHVQNAHDGVLDEVPLWRAQCGADAVVLIEDASTSCGVAFLMGTLDPAFAPYAFCIVSRTCATGYYTFGHELGHVMGLAHDRDNSSIKTSRASVSASSQSSNAPSYSPALSGDGRFVAFLSDAGNLVAGDTNGFDDVFVRDTLNRTTVRVNVSTSNAEANGAPLSAPAISRDGRYVAFDSLATSLAPGDTNGVADVFLRDTQANVTTRISVGPGGVQANGPSYGPAISGDGRLVAFTSEATNLVSGPPGSGTQVFVLDRNTGLVALASANTSGGSASGASTRAAISADGRFVAFTSTAPDLVPNDTNGRSDIFVRDMLLGSTERASLGSGGAEANGDSPYAPGISGDGRFVVFSSFASNLVHGDQNGTWDVFVFDRSTASTVRASSSLSGGDGDGPSGWNARPTINDDGRFAVFGSRAANLVADDTNGVDDVFRRDLQLGTTTRVSVTPSGNQGHAASGAVDQNTVCAIAPTTGGAVAFTSSAVLDVLDANGQQDVYVFLDAEPNPPGIDAWSYGYRTPDAQWRTIMSYAPGTRVQYFSNAGASWAGQVLGIADPSPYSAEAWRTLNGSASTVAAFTNAILVTFCFGDGSGTACPCGNASATGDEAGCSNSIGLEGRLVARGTASIAHDEVVLSGAGMPNSGALYFQGTAQQAGGAGAVFGDGLRCVGGTVRRLGTRFNASNASELPSSGDPSLSVLGAITSAGTVHYQVWYRNADPAFCTPSTFNWTNGVWVGWSP